MRASWYGQQGGAPAEQARYEFLLLLVKTSRPTRTANNRRQWRRIRCVGMSALVGIPIPPCRHFPLRRTDSLKKFRRHSRSHRKNNATTNGRSKPDIALRAYRENIGTYQINIPDICTAADAMEFPDQHLARTLEDEEKFFDRVPH